MSRQLCLIVCANFEREIRSLATLEEFRDVHLLSLPVECDLVEGTWQGLSELVERCRNDGHSVCPVGSYCLTQALARPELADSCQAVQKSQCLEWVADKDVIDGFLKADALVILPGWLKGWRQHLENRWSGDKKGAQAFFRESGKRVVLFDTGVHPKVEADLADFARFLRLPHERYPVGLGHLRLSLAQLSLTWRRDQDRLEAEERQAGLRQKMDDYARLGHLLDAVAKSRREDEAMAGVLELFRLLLSPGDVSYRPVQSFPPDPGPEGSPQDRILSLNADSAWMPGRNGIYLKVASGRETLGIIEVVWSRPGEAKEHELNMGLALAKIAGMAISNARGLETLESEKTKAQAAESALKISEEKIQSVYEGVPVGLYRTTPAGQIIDANAALARMLGYPDVPSLKAVNSWDLHVNPGDRESWQSVLDGSHFIETFETQLRRWDGTLIWVRDTSRAVRDGRGQAVFYDGSFEDITKKKQTEAALSWSTQVRMSLSDVSSRLLSPAPIEEVSVLILDHARRLTSSRSGAVGFIDERSGKLRMAAMTQDGRDMRASHPDLPSGHEQSGLWSWVLRNEKPIVTNFPTLDPRFTGMPGWHLPVGQFLAAPAFMAAKLVGLIAVANTDKMYSERELEAVERLAALYALAVYRMRVEEELRELSLEDELTGLYNRRGFMTLAQQQFKVAHRSKKEMFLLYADLDDMKTINDTLGHHVGDSALTATASILRDAFRESDIIARFGGDEFVVLAVDAGDGRSDALARRVRDKFESWNARSGQRYRLSISLGIAHYRPDKSMPLEDLLALADKRMYADKAEKPGRTVDPPVVRPAGPPTETP